VKKTARKPKAAAAEPEPVEKPKRAKKKAEAEPEPETKPKRAKKAKAEEVAPEPEAKPKRGKKAAAEEPAAEPVAKPTRVRLKKAEPEAVLVTVDLEAERKKPRKSKAKKKPPEAADAAKALCDLIVKTLDDNKAEEILTIDLAGKTSIADFMVIANGRSGRQVTALADYVVKAVDGAGFGPCRLEGKSAADWVLIDATDVIVHLFRPEVRDFYKLEKMWQADFRPDAE